MIGLSCLVLLQLNYHLFNAKFLYPTKKYNRRKLLVQNFREEFCIYPGLCLYAYFVYDFVF